MSATALISRGALEHNLRALAARSTPSQVMFVVKANGYGHGDVAVSTIAYRAGIRHFGCLEIETALKLRANISDPSVMLLAWQFSDRDDLSGVIDGDVDLGVGSGDLLDLLEKSHDGNRPFRIHIKVDTGLNRNGVPRDNWIEFVDRVVALENAGVVNTVGVWTHIAETDDEADERAHADFSAARRIAESRLGKNLFAHLAASSASFRIPSFRFDAVRVGGHAYGIPSFDGITPAEMGLVPVLTMTAPVRRGTTQRDGEVLIVDAGFVDGVPGYAAGAVEVTVNGIRCRVLRVEENSLVARYEPGADGDVATLFGSGENGEQTVRQWGDALGTLGDEITCRLSPELERHYVD